MVLILALLAIGLVMTGPVRAVAEPLGIGSTAVDVWNYAKWPVMIVLVLTPLRRALPLLAKRPDRAFRFLHAGAGVALLVWILVSAGFAFWVCRQRGSYNETYGTLGGFRPADLVLDLNLAVLFGLEPNSEFERSRQISAGSAGPNGSFSLIRGRTKAETKNGLKRVETSRLRGFQQYRPRCGAATGPADQQESSQ